MIRPSTDSENVDRMTAEVKLTFLVNFEVEDTNHMRQIMNIAHDLEQAVRSACRGSDDTLRYKSSSEPFISYVTPDKGDDFL